MRESYRTRQQEELRRILEKTPGRHYTVAQLRTLLMESGQPIGTTTIYRQLDKLVEDGVVQKYLLETGDSACYAFIGEHEECASHFHCKCEECGQLIHMDCEELAAIQKHILDHHGFCWNMGRTIFYGICDQCRKA